MSGTRADEIVQLAAFKVGAEEYVIDIMRVREIIRPIPITPVRKGPRYVEGVISLRHNSVAKNDQVLTANTSC